MNIPETLNNPKKNLIEGYFKIHAHFQKQYGQHTIVLMELGSFFEIYGVETETDTIGCAREIAEVLNIQLTRKNKKIKENSLENPLMAGFPTATFDRYINRLIQEKKYTIVIIRQKGTPPNISRYVDQIISPGVHIDYCLDHTDNFVTSLVIDTHNDIYTIGYAAIDTSTGKTYLYEGYGTKDDPYAALDTIYGFLQSQKTAEIILCPKNKHVSIDYVKEHLEITAYANVHVRNNNYTVDFQNEILGRAYKIKSFLSPIEFLNIETNQLTSESLAHLLQFVIEHDEKIVANLETPIQLSHESYLYLGNNALEQLNIVSKDPAEQTVISLFDFTTTSIGKRLFRDRITHPITDKKVLEGRYTLVENIAPITNQIAPLLKNVYDLERISRRITLDRLHPYEINFLYESLCSAQGIAVCITNKQVKRHLNELFDNYSLLENCISYIESTFNLDQTTTFTQQSVRTSIFNAGYDHALEGLLQKQKNLYDTLTKIQQKFEKLLVAETGKDETDSVILKRGDKEGHHFSITKGRFSLIQAKIQDTFLQLDGDVIALSDFNYRTLTTSVKITAGIIQEVSKEIIHTESRIIALVKKLFSQELAYIDEQFNEIITICSKTLAAIDVAISTNYAAQKLRLCKPEIVDTQTDETYISLHALRHPLVEASEENGIYVPNDIVFGTRKHFTKTNQQMHMAQANNVDIHGMLLYGINASGKSSLMKSIGIAIILAQSGMYVPAASMQFGIFNELFTRIIAQDNFARGLSSFGVEMVELKNILHRCTPKSMILGDEISHGTETLSAIAIVSATIKRLIEKKSCFLFTTHLHQIHSLQLLKDIHNVISMHLSIHYDKTSDTLIFDRKLKQGNGSAIYGLEFAQSLHMDAKFLNYARAIRKSLTDTQSDLEHVAKQNTSKYNKKLFLQSCALCKKNVDDVHHIVPQQNADAQGNIKHFHKNHKYNLLPICKKCHQDIHAQKIQVKGFMMTNNGLELMYEKREIDTKIDSNK